MRSEADGDLWPDGWQVGLLILGMKWTTTAPGPAWHLLVGLCQGEGVPPIRVAIGNPCP